MTDTTPTTPAPVDPALTQRVTEAARTVLDGTGPRTTDEWAALVAAAVLAELAPELARAADVGRLQIALRANQAAALEATERAEKAEADAKRLGELIDRLGPTEQKQRHRAEKAETALTRAREAALLEGAAAIQAVIDADRAKFPARSNDRAALGGARQIILGLLESPIRALTGPAEENTP